MKATVHDQILAKLFEDGGREFKVIYEHTKYERKRSCHMSGNMA